MRHLIAPITLALALVASPGFLSVPSLMAEDKKAHDHKDHDHKDGDKDHAHEAKPLGEASLGGAAFTVALEGHLKAGSEVEVKLTPKGALPKGTVRAWIGVESGKGSSKGKAHDEDGGLCVHAEVPDPIPADAKVWVELDQDGNKSRVGLPLAK
jgi:hypothetical protein